MERFLGAVVLAVLAAGCGGGSGGGGGGNVSLEIRNETVDTVLTRAEFVDPGTGAVAASAGFSIPPGGTWQGTLDLADGSYYTVVWGTDVGSGETCSVSSAGLGVTEDIGPGERNLTWIYRGLFCDGGDDIF